MVKPKFAEKADAGQLALRQPRLCGLVTERDERRLVAGE